MMMRNDPAYLHGPFWQKIDRILTLSGWLLIAFLAYAYYMNSAYNIPVNGLFKREYYERAGLIEKRTSPMLPSDILISAVG